MSQDKRYYRAILDVRRDEKEVELALEYPQEAEDVGMFQVLPEFRLSPSTLR